MLGDQTNYILMLITTAADDEQLLYSIQERYAPHFSSRLRIHARALGHYRMAALACVLRRRNKCNLKLACTQPRECTTGNHRTLLSVHARMHA
eukprot:5944175-Pleurochrysis_carterae.AAC.5